MEEYKKESKREKKRGKLINCFKLLKGMKENEIRIRSMTERGIKKEDSLLNKNKIRKE